MASRIKRPCARPGCSTLVVSGYCDRCRPKAPAKMLSKARPSAAARGYGPRWRKTSAGWLQKHPWCVDPYKVHLKFPEPADCTDHIIPHKGNMVLFWDPTNWQSLCGTCHSRKTASEEGGFGNDVSGQKAVPAGTCEGVPSTGAG